MPQAVPVVNHEEELHYFANEERYIPSTLCAMTRTWKSTASTFMVMLRLKVLMPTTSRLARRRAAALKNYVAQLYPIDAKLFSSDYTPEDWDGFRRKVQQSQLANKDEILKISDSRLAPDDKDKRIRQLYPQDYAVIMKDIYPRLRHSDYTVSYTVRPFSVEEAKQILRTRPQQLSLSEMYLVAQTMEAGSPEFNEVFEIAVRMFPCRPDSQPLMLHVPTCRKAT